MGYYPPYMPDGYIQSMKVYPSPLLKPKKVTRKQMRNVALDPQKSRQVLLLEQRLTGKGKYFDQTV